MKKQLKQTLRGLAATVGGAALLAGAALAESYTYDTLGRLTRIDFDDGSHVEFTHDDSGNRNQVKAVNDPPTALNDSITTNEDVSKTFDPRDNDSDPDYDAMIITGKTNGSKGIVVIEPGGVDLTYSPYNNANGSDSFTYTISDGSQTDTATVNVTINPVNDDPVANNDYFYGVDMNVWTTLNVKGGGDSSPDYDVDGDVFTIASVTEGTGDVEIINDGHAVRYKCSCLQSDDVFSYTISDGNGGTDTAAVAVFGGIDPQSVENPQSIETPQPVETEN